MKESLLQVAERADQFFMGTSNIHASHGAAYQDAGRNEDPVCDCRCHGCQCGHRRTTEDIDILIRREDLARFKEQHLGRGWVDKFTGSKNFRELWQACGQEDY
ncbi:MAG: hypothetical protein R3C56_34025 [Pirellulaceae bacterium]